MRALSTTPVPVLPVKAAPPLKAAASASRRRRASREPAVSPQLLALGLLLAGRQRQVSDVRQILADVMRDAEVVLRGPLERDEQDDAIQFNAAATLIAERTRLHDNSYQRLEKATAATLDADVYGLVVDAAEQGVFLGLAIAARVFGVAHRGGGR